MIAKTISGAAKMLGTSQPGLSRMLAHMEDRLQFRLFDRTRGRIVPTREASVLFEEIEHVYKGISDLDHVISRLGKGADRTFRVGASPSLGHSVLPRMLARLTANYPALQIQFDILSVEQAHDWLVLQRGDYALTVFPIDHPSILSSRIGHGRMVCTVPADHRLADRQFVELADLRGERIQSFRQDTPRPDHRRDVRGGRRDSRCGDICALCRNGGRLRRQWHGHRAGGQFHRNAGPCRRCALPRNRPAAPAGTSPVPARLHLAQSRRRTPDDRRDLRGNCAYNLAQRATSTHRNAVRNRVAIT
ncbi:LysR family transcriptional regulator [Novosphingobium sp. 9]|uniref:LysR family transcriptional regulator n=1 Tax=Novosphingobium sp. 9 TaxID=2025349 RepID=UPI0021B50B11|nr:LysR substrate-binding domain-containing protein [Novosphingobium sp. 9]